jgi:hypothetical protein
MNSLLNVRLLPLLGSLTVALGCGTGGGVAVVSGTALVDGSPVEIGTISLRPKDDSRAKGVGGPIQNGAFQLLAKEGLPPGKYDAFVLASKKTGRVVKDPQRGDVEEMKQLNLQNSPQEIEINPGNAGSLKLEFASGKS